MPGKADTADESGNELLVSNMQTLLESLSEERYKESAEICQSVLKEFNKKSKSKSSNKKGEGDDTDELRDSLVDILIRCWFQLELYQKIKEWIPQQRQHHALPNEVKFLDLYASYRMKEYKTVIKKLSSSSSTTEERHLLAQALYRGSDASKSKNVYHELIDEIAGTVARLGDNGDDVSEAQEQQVELWTNYLAVLLADSVPYVDENTEDIDADKTSKDSEVISASADLLDITDPDSQFYQSDLAYNLGSYQCLSSGTTKLLDRALSHFPTKPELQTESQREDMATILGNRLWSRQWNDSADDDIDEATRRANMTFVSKHGTAATKTITKFNQQLSGDASKIHDVEPEDGWNTLQVRLYWYNRAVAYLRAGSWNDCRKACQSLQKALPSSSAKQDDGTSASGADGNDSAWWGARCDILLAHALWNEGGKEKTGEAWEKAILLLEKRRDRLQSQLSPSIASKKLENALAHIQIHLHHLRGSQQQPVAKTIEFLEKDLPPSIRSRKAVQAMLSSLSGNSGSHSPTENSADGEISTRKADALLSQGEYEQAAAMYQELLPSNPKQCTPEQVQEMLRYVQALGLSNPQEADKVWGALKDHILSIGGGAEKQHSLSGEALASKELPKSKLVGTTGKTALGGSKISSQHRATDSTKVNTKKKSTEAVLRRRARQRESYLEELTTKGLYSASRPTKPNPDRWIPKRDRGGRKGNAGYSRGAQGSAASGDARKLDAAARKAGGSSGDAGPSTANIKVSASGGGRKGGRRR